MKKLLVVLLCYSLAACQEKSGRYKRSDNPDDKNKAASFKDKKLVSKATDRLKEKLLKYSYECKASNELSDDIFNNMGRILQKQSALECYHECYFKKSGDMKPDGTFARDIMIQKIPIWLVDWCIEDLNVMLSFDDCTRAYQMYKCMRRPLMNILGFAYEED